jgi:hypothetical protein
VGALENLYELEDEITRDIVLDYTVRAIVEDITKS